MRWFPQAPQIEEEEESIGPALVGQVGEKHPLQNI
jgi:hypothetical protein